MAEAQNIWEIGMIASLTTCTLFISYHLSHISIASDFAIPSRL